MEETNDINVEGTVASATQARETGLVATEYDKKKRRKKRFFEGVK